MWKLPTILRVNQSDNTFLESKRIVSDDAPHRDGTHSEVERLQIRHVKNHVCMKLIRKYFFKN